MITHPKVSLILSLIAMSLSLITLGVVYLQKPQLATVDMGQLINRQAAQLGQQYTDGKVPTAVMQHIISDLKEQMKELAKEQKTILLTKGAVLSGSLPDYTDLLNESLKQWNEEQEKEEG